ncbi:hypothetical protein A2291_08675 [candidate division WOR-1 bacterium RIFOXYB2_FULL_42_35]|uniref:Methyltransferase type 11 domain-containing protein n=1 Tax=candidate division WOR-1 bacterium RIFOXYC2_FULL_41_25 TaxID=1802586 RepID=A0A1F4TM58_UNCSA|nr:MAG: hypothetical protein A2291_08675 [candidate division WOR-1 bacterium RIFOXYB2_FULL_42_35]OGC23077.1 MAG: hypothetical protein A2247_08575 [candidate division WOR-1 bacterium RIFOXYA2_FULL_41_14]OGC33649.1 MAG: hypothetical protein A2462_02265 [candidate division WOR-1 bacterium RIFOXYC2_FULL_41_25]OGC43612.1 MAG: hypothetical protein A2548_02355 [candidate division WOR-1 bacterium RIFOXYD2_FULL_41_8]
MEINTKEYEAWYTTPKGEFVDVLEKEVISELCNILPGDKVLEIGCGTGHFSAYFSKLRAEVTALDTSPDMLHLAREKYGNLQVDFKAGDAYKLPFADRSFDLVAMITVLEFIANPKQALREAFRVSKDKVFLGILNKNSYLAWRRKKSDKKIWQEAHSYTLKEIFSFLGQEREIKWRAVLYLPLINNGFLFNFRLWLERLFSRLKLPYGAFVGIIVRAKNERS